MRRGEKRLDNTLGAPGDRGEVDADRNDEGIPELVVPDRRSRRNRHPRTPPALRP